MDPESHRSPALLPHQADPSTRLAHPRVELHVHLDTSLLYPAAKQLIPDLTPEAFRERWVAPPLCRDLTHFLDTVNPAIDLLQTEHALETAFQALVADLQRDQVIYAEIRFAPLLHTRRGLSPRQVAHTVCRCAREQESVSGVTLRLIFCTLRSFRADESLATAQLALDFRRDGVAGLDLAGDESGYGLAPHVPAFRLAQEENMPCTAHAGEARGPESVRETLRLLQPQRIGHGVRSVEDPDLVRELADRRIHLEICPGSNIQTRVVKRMQDHPIDQLYRAGIPLSISTDGRGISQTNLTREYRLVREAFGWTSRDFQQTNLMAIEAAFCDKDVKSRLATLLSDPEGEAMDPHRA